MRLKEAPVRAFAFCRNARCSGYQEQEIDAVREETEYTYWDGHGQRGERDALSEMTERSMVSYRFADESEAACPGCGRPREVSGTPRPSYQPLSGHDPMGLLSFGGFDPNLRIPAGDDRTVELEQKLAAMQEQMQALIDAQAEKEK